jgi:L-lactate dehydrogenase (cytochrome)
MFQVLIFRDRDLTFSLVDRARSAGFPALCITADAAVRGKRERELRSGLGLPLRLSPQSAAQFASRPAWYLRHSLRGPFSFAHFADRAPGTGLIAHSQYAAEQLDPSVTWRDVRNLFDRWRGPRAIKGILSADDARCAVDEAGASAVIVSNHGGRQLDGAAASLEVLPRIVEAVGDRAEIILDGGVRRGTHVLKALALGAKACSLGRPYLWGLAAGGESGVRHALDILRSELIRDMRLSGCADLAAIRPHLVQRF